MDREFQMAAEHPPDFSVIQFYLSNIAVLSKTITGTRLVTKCLQRLITADNLVLVFYFTFTGPSVYS
jgi:hypothetical protein